MRPSQTACLEAGEFRDRPGVDSLIVCVSTPVCRLCGRCLAIPGSPIRITVPAVTIAPTALVGSLIRSSNLPHSLQRGVLTAPYSLHPLCIAHSQCTAPQPLEVSQVQVNGLYSSDVIFQKKLTDTDRYQMYKKTVDRFPTEPCCLPKISRILTSGVSTPDTPC